MIHPLHEAYARLLTGYCTEITPGDHVQVTIDTLALPLARPLYRAILAAGGEPHLRLVYPDQLGDLLELASEALLASAPTVDQREIEAMDAYIRVDAPENSRALQAADKTRYARYQARMQGVTRHRVEHTRWVITRYPTASGAQDAGMSLDEYERFVYDAMYLHDADPVARWREQHAFQARLIERLAQASEVRIVAEGTDLRLAVGGRAWVNSDGHKNMPSGEVFTGPLEDSAEGTITYTIPSSVNGVGVEGIRLRFEGGKVVEASADKGDDMLQAQLASDSGARFVGELGIGTNDRIQRSTRNTLFDEKIGGTVHLALGRSYPETGGVNDSAIHWDMICDLRRGGALYLDGELFQQDGEFRL